MPFEFKKTLSPLYNIKKTKSRILEAEVAALEELQAAAARGSGSNAAGGPSEPETAPLEQENDDDDGFTMECGCCYVDYSIKAMTQCEDGHLFCLECARKAAEVLIGLRKTTLSCLDSSGCKFHFPRAEIERFLTPQVLIGYDRLVQEENLRVAGISDLTACPFCDYAVIMQTDPQVDRLMTCRSETCGVISCRLCKRKNHLPQTCEEAAKDDVLSVRHKIEEAMTQALLRQCSKCTSQFYKTEGCNKMQCPRCQTIMCYVCKKVITGYDHFSTSPNGAPQSGNTCALWDNTESRNAKEVQQAFAQAVADAKKLNPGVEEKDIQVELPKEPVAPPVVPHGLAPGVAAAAAAALGVPYVPGGAGRVVVGGAAGAAQQARLLLQQQQAHYARMLQVRQQAEARQRAEQRRLEKQRAKQVAEVEHAARRAREELQKVQEETAERARLGARREVLRGVVEGRLAGMRAAREEMARIDVRLNAIRNAKRRKVG
ncbi:hypothetical protein HDU98_002298 [Podochytrium sp. JEL0797]|nr:hypothetical protein HDU98_002298 [Podochytrium sp. JEL0797]